MTGVLAEIAKDVLLHLQIFGENYKSDSSFYHLPELWKGLLDAGLPPLCTKVVCDIHLFNETSVRSRLYSGAPRTDSCLSVQSWVLDLMKVFDAIVSTCRYVVCYTQSKPEPLYNVVCYITTMLWDQCRQNRNVFEDGNPLDQVTPGMAKELRCSLRSMLSSDQRLRRQYVIMHATSSY